MIKKETIKDFECDVIDTNKVHDYIYNISRDGKIKRIIVYTGIIKELTICEELQAVLMCKQIYNALRKEAGHWIKFRDNEPDIMFGIPIIMID